MFVDIYNTNKKYNIIYADPPWSYRTWNAKDGHKSASAHYNTMNQQSIEALGGGNSKYCGRKQCVVFVGYNAESLGRFRSFEKVGFYLQNMWLYLGKNVHKRKASHRIRLLD